MASIDPQQQSKNRLHAFKNKGKDQDVSIRATFRHVSLPFACHCCACIVRSWDTWCLAQGAPSSVVIFDTYIQMWIMWYRKQLQHMIIIVHSKRNCSQLTKSTLRNSKQSAMNGSKSIYCIGVCFNKNSWIATSHTECESLWSWIICYLKLYKSHHCDAERWSCCIPML